MGKEPETMNAPSLCPSCGAYWQCGCPKPADDVPWVDQVRVSVTWNPNVAITEEMLRQTEARIDYFTDEWVRVDRYGDSPPPHLP